MTKARTLADFISDGSPLADGTISVSEVSGAAPIESPTFTGTVTATSVSLNALLPTNAFAALVLNNAVGIANDPVAIDTWLETTASDGYKYGDMDKNGIIQAYDGSLIVQLAGGVASEAVTSRWTDIVVPSLVQQSWYADLVADGTLTGGGAFSGPLTGNVTGDLDLTAIAKNISDTAVDVFVYDTSKDSDGGAWRKRTQGTSWYNETLNTATRGSRKEFPAVAVIVGTSTKLTIYDGDDPDLPMWMVFDANVSANDLMRNSGIDCIAAQNGSLLVGLGNGFGLIQANMIADHGFHWTATSSAGYYNSYIADRNNASNFTRNIATPIVNNYTNDVAMTVLPNAPIDAATGLPVPTIAVATAGGVSVIKDDGTVVDLTKSVSANNVSNDVAFTETNGIAWGSRANFNVYGYYLQVLFEIPSSDYSGSPDLLFTGIENTASSDFKLVTPATNSGGVVSALVGEKHIGGGSGLTLFDRDNSNSANSLVAYTTSTYNTGWMNGDIKLATLSDTDDAAVTGSELVTNGDFSSGTTGWNAFNAVISVSSGQMTVDDTANAGSNSSAISNGISLSAGIYTISVEVVSTTDSAYIAFTTNNSGTPNGSWNVAANQTAGVYSKTITVTGTSTYYVWLCTNGTGVTVFDNISVRLAEEDRSVNGNGLQVFGTVTKNPVATGADLVAYSGFSSSSPYNSLQQPYNSDFDFTGDFSAMLWVYSNDTGTGTRLFFDRVASGWPTPPARFFFGTDSSDYLYYYVNDSNGTSTGNTAKVLQSGIWNHCCFVRRGRAHEIYLNGILQISQDKDIRDITQTGATLTLGNAYAFGNPFDGSLALARISATAPSPEQIKKIYEDEKVLFQENAQATLYGSSDAVTALAYDDTTELLHVGTSEGRSDFQGLRRVNNTTNAVGAAISASNGMIVEE
jgi:trimeric autotransporter adhesin